jgi:hypothetical protein
MFVWHQCLGGICEIITQGRLPPNHKFGMGWGMEPYGYNLMVPQSCNMTIFHPLMLYSNDNSNQKKKKNSEICWIFELLTGKGCQVFRKAAQKRGGPFFWETFTVSE